MSDNIVKKPYHEVMVDNLQNTIIHIPALLSGSIESKLNDIITLCRLLYQTIIPDTAVTEVNTALRAQAKELTKINTEKFEKESIEKLLKIIYFLATVNVGEKEIHMEILTDDLHY